MFGGFNATETVDSKETDHEFIIFNVLALSMGKSTMMHKHITKNKVDQTERSYFWIVWFE